jgi:hypothetical protein
MQLNKEGKIAKREREREREREKALNGTAVGAVKWPTAKGVSGAQGAPLSLGLT